MSRKKTKSQHAKIAARRLVEDEEIQKQLRVAAVRVREAWSRASRRPASKAVSDKQVYDKVREAAASLATVTRRLGRQPEPPKRTGRKLVAGAALLGGAAYAVKRKRSTNGAPDHASQPGPTATAPAPPAPFPVTPVEVT
jgi:hypothetical protein